MTTEIIEENIFIEKDILELLSSFHVCKLDDLYISQIRWIRWKSQKFIRRIIELIYSSTEVPEKFQSKIM